METWILILTLVAPSASGGSAIAQVPGFISQQACMDDGNMWLTHKPVTWSRASAICVPSK